MEEKMYYGLVDPDTIYKLLHFSPFLPLIPFLLISRHSSLYAFLYGPCSDPHCIITCD
jgi:hypothetical protein